MVYADEILDYSGQRKTGVTAGSYGPASDVSPEAGGTITVPQLTVNEKGLITGAVERTVTLPSGGGGGGGEEEQFQKVYETTVQDPAEMLMITSADLDGSYVDVVMCVSNEQPLSGDAGYEFSFTSDEGGEDVIAEGAGTIPGNGSWDIIVSAISVGGLLELGKTVGSINGIDGSKMFAPAASIVYPSVEKPGVVLILLAIENGIPAGTKVTVYARRKVTDNAEA